MNENDKFIISTPAGLRLGDSEFETKKSFEFLKKKIQMTLADESLGTFRYSTSNVEKSTLSSMSKKTKGRLTTSEPLYDILVIIFSFREGNG